MHLLNTSSITLLEVNSDKPPPYAILSHRWEKSEVSFQNMRDGKGTQKPGYKKIVSCCAQAAEDGWSYVWIDSCCIDKTSSAELSEAINSMFRWYRNAQVCYAYLSDVVNHGGPSHSAREAFRNSKWFTRGWTLQELLAPENVVFFDRDWVDIGTKISLKSSISVVTGIKDLFAFESSCVAQKMSWAAKRHTTRVEDQAYCLMGLFGVNMPLLYGEGEKAFMRLQLEILRTVDDESIFAWTEDAGPGIPWEDNTRFSFSTRAGLLASSPNAFKFSGDVQRTLFDENRQPYSMTNKGLRIEPLLAESRIVPSLSISADDWPGPDEDMYLMPLNCGRIGKTGHLAVYLHRALYQFQRAGPSKLVTFDTLQNEPQVFASFQRTVVYVKQLDRFPGTASVSSIMQPYILSIRMLSLLEHGISISDRFYRTGGRDDSSWIEDTSEGPQFAFDPNASTRARAEVRFAENGAEAFSVVLRCQPPRILINILVPHERQSLDEVRLPAISIVDKEPFLDRMSQRIRSGKSISVALKQTHQSEGKKYWVNITADPTGYLKWPNYVLTSFSSAI